MSSQLWRVLPVLASLAALLALSGCDDPNTADIPPQPYRLISVTTPPATALDVDAEGIYAGVAASGYGPIVYDVSDLAHPVQIYRDTLALSGTCRRVAIETVHHFIYVDTDGTQADDFYMNNFLDGTRPFISNFTFTSNVDEVITFANQDCMFVYRTDFSPGDGLQSKLLCKTNDTTWSSTACPWWDEQWIPLRPRVRGLGLRPSDKNVIAVAVDDQGIHLHQANPPQALSDLITTGVAYDCAWTGNYIIVADRYRITVVDASDVSHPFIATSMVITNADRLAKVVIDGNYALFLDETDGVYVVDVSNPLAPKHIQSISLPEPTSLDAVDGKLFVTDGVQGLVIYAR